jgi:1,4-dihydroxy-2-naphthoate octaprenyltransferase
LLAFARLIKPRSQAASLCTLVAMSLAWGQHEDPRYWAVMLSFLLFNFLGGALTVVLDDMVGFEDGADQQDVVLNQKRNISKPLLTGDLSVADAKRAAMFLAVLEVILLACLVLLARRTGLAFLYLATLIILVPQYSFGLKLSYWGLGEVLIASSAFACVALPVWLYTDAVTPRVMLTGALVGIPYAAHLVVANVIDYENDKSAGRRTIPVMVGLGRSYLVSGAFLLLFWALYAYGMLTHELPRAALLWLPMLLSHVRFMRLATGGDPARARLLSFTNFHLVFVLFSAANVLAVEVPALR